jgi:hypothetical protein
MLDTMELPALENDSGALNMDEVHELVGDEESEDVTLAADDEALVLEMEGAALELAVLVVAPLSAADEALISGLMLEV